MNYILFFSEASQQDIEEIGVKGANLAFLFKRGFNVPPGFIISSKLFESFVGKADDTNAPEIQRKLEEIEFPEDVKEEVLEAYYSLSVDINSDANSLLETKEVFVAVRSCYIRERGKTPGLSQKTILNVKGEERLFRAILNCYISHFDSKLVDFRKQNNINPKPPAIIVQKMINAQKSGVAYSVNPETGKNEIVIKACFGLGEGLVGGSVFPDTYVVDKDTLTVQKTDIGEKKYAYVRDIETEKTTKHKLGNKSVKQVLFDPDIVEIARQVKKIVNSIGRQQKVEWSMKGTDLYILQTKGIEMEQKEPESVEMEVYDSSEAEEPKIIDISEDDFEDDLMVLDEIEKYEEKLEQKKDEDTLEEGEKEEIKIEEEKETPEYSFGITSMEEKEVEDEIVKEETEEKIEDQSIFSSYGGLEDSTGVNKYYDLAKLNAGNIIVYCHLAIKEKMRQRLKKYVKEIPEDFEKLLNELLEYETVQNEEELIKLAEIRDQFINNLRYPEPDEVQLALRLVKQE